MESKGLVFRIVRRRPRRTLRETPETLRLREEAKAFLPGRLRELAGRHGFEFNQVRIKHNVSNWGSCSSKGNVMLHELCHLRQMNHGPEFHALLESLCPDWKECRAKLKEYRLI